jgi:hypothetical protein
MFADPDVRDVRFPDLRLVWKTITSITPHMKTAIKTDMLITNSMLLPTAAVVTALKETLDGSATKPANAPTAALGPNAAGWMSNVRPDPDARSDARSTPMPRS